MDHGWGDEAGHEGSCLAVPDLRPTASCVSAGPSRSRDSRLHTAGDSRKSLLDHHTREPAVDGPWRRRRSAPVTRVDNSASEV